MESTAYYEGDATVKAQLFLEDGTVFVGTSFGATGEAVGEVVFNTSMTGYQEIVTDPSYCNQMIVMTYPLIGNYGVSRDHSESLHSYASGLIVREHADLPYREDRDTIDHFLKDQEIPGISGIDTRMLTRKIRAKGTMKGILTTEDMSLEELGERMNLPLLRNQVIRCSTKSIYISPHFGKKRVVLIDFGAKYSIQRELVQRNCEVVSIPYDTTAKEILRYRPDGVVLSNGPGDPKDVQKGIQTIQELMGKVPLFGICLGHQLFALACGADTKKLKFGHRGGNHPVREMGTGRNVITSQNHGYAVTSESLRGTPLQKTHISLHDGSIEGLKHEEFPAFSVQYHPESAPGPRDSGYLFDVFYEQMSQFQEKGESSYA